MQISMLIWCILEHTVCIISYGYQQTSSFIDMKQTSWRFLSIKQKEWIPFYKQCSVIYVICIPLRILASNRISILDNSNTTGDTSWSETAYPSGVPEFIPSSCFVGFMLLHLHFSVLCFVDHFVFFLLTMYCLYFFNFRCGLSLWYLQTFLNTHFCS
jgi:hypothetical protein